MLERVSACPSMEQTTLRSATSCSLGGSRDFWVPLRVGAGDRRWEAVTWRGGAMCFRIRAAERQWLGRQSLSIANEVVRFFGSTSFVRFFWFCSPVGLWATRQRCPHFHRSAAERS
jgi:hypothetical protein